MERDVFDRLKRLEKEHWWFVARRRILDSFIVRLTDKDRCIRILEAGCGTGGNLGMLARHGDVAAFEPDDEARFAASRENNIDVAHGTLPEELPYADDQFDLVVAFDVLEHVKEDEESLKALLERLEPDGSLLLTVPALPSLWSGHDERHHHYRRYTKSSLQRVLENAGYRIVRISYFNTLLFPLIAGLRYAKRALGIDNASDEKMPPRWLNKILTLIFSSERHVLGRFSMPVGVSLLAVAQKARL